VSERDELEAGLAATRRALAALQQRRDEVTAPVQQEFAGRLGELRRATAALEGEVAAVEAERARNQAQADLLRARRLAAAWSRGWAAFAWAMGLASSVALFHRSPWYAGGVVAALLGSWWFSWWVGRRRA
jgi:hypothetical protein